MTRATSLAIDFTGRATSISCEAGGGEECYRGLEGSGILVHVIFPTCHIGSHRIGFENDTLIRTVWGQHRVAVADTPWFRGLAPGL
jgi:hypothetical protein